MTADLLDLHHNHRLGLTYEPIDTIKLNPRDARTYGVVEKRRIAKAIKTFGAMPLIVTPDRVVLSGNVWLEAARLAGIEHLPIVVAEYLTPAQADAFMLAQVRLLERGEWDANKLGEIFRDLTLEDLDFDIEITGFDTPEIDLYIEGLDQPQDGPDPADQLPEAGPIVTRPDDLWRLGPHRILCGNALLEASYSMLMGDKTANIVFADPPYNVRIAGNVSGLGGIKHSEFAMASGEMTEAEFTTFLTQALRLASTHSADASLAYWCMDWRHLAEITAAGRAAYDALQNLCVWTKSNGAMGAFYRSQHELVFVFKKGQAAHRNNIQLGRFGRNRTNVWSYPGANSFGRGGGEGDLLAMHPTVKPVALISDVLLDASARRGLVLDPFLGSGSTLIAAEKVGRRAYGIEIDPGYVDCAVRRWERWTGRKAFLAGSQKSFTEIETERKFGANNG